MEKKQRHKWQKTKIEHTCTACGCIKEIRNLNGPKYYMPDGTPYHHSPDCKPRLQATEGKQDKKLSGKCWTCNKPIEPETEGFCDDCWEKGKQEGGVHE